MSVYFITYHMQSNSHHHDHEHGENCNCGGDPDYDLVCEIETLGRWAHLATEGPQGVADVAFS